MQLLRKAVGRMTFAMVQRKADTGDDYDRRGREWEDVKRIRVKPMKRGGTVAERGEMQEAVETIDWETRYNTAIKPNMRLKFADGRCQLILKADNVQEMNQVLRLRCDGLAKTDNNG